MLNSLFTPDTASFTLSSMYLAVLELHAGNFRQLPVDRLAKILAVFRGLPFLAFGFNSTSDSITSKPLMSVPSSGPAKLADHGPHFGEGRHDLGGICWATRAASDGEMDSGMKARTQSDAFIQLGQKLACPAVHTRSPRPAAGGPRWIDELGRFQREVQHRAIDAAPAGGRSRIRARRFFPDGETGQRRHDRSARKSCPAISANVRVSAIGLKIFPSTRCIV